MTKHLRLIFLLLFLYSFTILSVKAQNSFGSEEELKKQAQKLYEEEAYEEAYPLYTQLTSLYPKDAVYNYRLGVCMIFASDDKEKPIPFLEFASKKSDTEKEVFYFLAKAYHLNYRFDDAIAMYVKYRSVAKPAKLKSLQVERQIEMCKNGRALLKNVTDLIVLDKKEMSKVDFFRSYDISSIGGKLLVKPDDPAFKSAVDKKKKEQSIIYLAADNSQVYYASYGANDANGKDIFISRKLPNGEWSKPQTLGYPLNTQYDEDYPFLHPNGRVLYFCSKGHNSMGGYDVFKSTMNESGVWGPPVNMDFPINTPDDDILYVTDKDEKQAYFTSARSSITGKTSVYHIDVKRKPTDISIIAGTVVKGKENQPLDLKIAIKNVENNSILGVYYSNAANGEYKLDLPNGGKYMYTVEAKGFPTQSEVVALPVQYELKPLKQEITFDKSDKLVIKNLFDADPGESGYMFALNYIKEKSKMDVTEANKINAANDLAKKLAKARADSIANYKPPVVENKVDNSAANNQLITAANNAANEDAKEARLLNEQVALANDVAIQKTKLAEVKEKEGNQAEAEQLNKEALFATNIAQKLKVNADAKQKEADLSKSYAENLEKEIKNNNSPDQALAALSQQKKELDIITEKNKELENVELSYKNNIESKQKELDNVKQKSLDLKQEIADNETLIKGYEADIEKTKKKDVKQNLENQITALKQENVDKQKEIEQNNVKVDQVQKVYDAAKAESDLVASVMNKSVSTASTSSVSGTSTEGNKTEATNSSSVNTSVVATNSASENKIGTNSSSSSVETPPMLKAINAQYDNELSKTNEIGSEAEKENAKAEVFEKWAKTIDEEIITKKKEYLNSTNESRKKQLTEEILASEQISKEKQNAAVASKQKATALGYKEPVAKNNTSSASTTNSSGSTNTTNNVTNTANGATNSGNTTASNTNTGNNSGAQTNTTNNTTTNTTASGSATSATVYNAKYAEELKTADISEGSQIEKETKKYQIYESWIATINNDIIAKKKELEKSNDQQRRTDLRNEITALQNDLSDKESIAEALSTNVESLKLQPVATNSNSENTSNNSSASSTNSSGSASTPKDTTNALVNNSSNNNASNNIGNTASTTNASGNNASNTNVVTNNNASITGNTTTTNSTSGNSATTNNSSNSNTTGNTNVATNNNASNAGNTTATNSTSGNNVTTNNSSNSNNTGNTNVTTNNNTSNSGNTTTSSKNTSNTGNTNAAASNNSSNSGNNASSVSPVTNAAVAKNIIPQNKLASINVPEKKSAASTSLKEANDLVNKSNELKAKAAATENAEEKNKFFAEAEVLTKQAEKKQLESAAYEEEANTAMFSYNFYTLEAIAKANANPNADDIAMAELKTEESNSYFEKAKKLREGAAKENVFYNKNALLIEAKSNEETAIRKQEEAFNIYKKYNPNFGAPVTQVAAANNNGSTNTGGNTATNNALRNNTSNVISSPLALGPDEKFERRNTSVYSSANPIPIDEKLPEGLVFKVQIGAFRNAIPQDLFEGITPITGETTPSGFTRYTAGLFKKFATANGAKGEVQKVGYRDAFVVAFFNGKRISLTEALAKTGESMPAADNTNSGNASSSNAGNVSTNVTNNGAANSVTNTGTVASERIEQVQGLFYTIQVGVFSQPVTPDKIYNIQPLYSETTRTGNIRYTTGMYNNINRAIEAKNVAVNIGVKDAFVAAYNKGKRINMSEAMQLESQGPSVMATSANVNKFPFADRNAVASTNVATNNNSTAGNSNVIFKVQLGAYKEQVPLDMVNKFLSISNKGIDNYKDASGLTIYTIGNFNNYDQAAKLKNEAVAASITGAFVVAYNNGNKISIEEAMRLIK